MASCDRHGELVIVPEYDFSYSFENGLEGWTPAAADLSEPPPEWSIEETADVASAGTHSARFRLDNAAGAGKIWVVRALEVTPDQAYDVEVSFSLGTSDGSGTQPWTLIVGAYREMPTTAAELSYFGDTQGEPGDGAELRWVVRRTTVVAQADEEGRLFVTLGVLGSSAETRTYYLDDVRLLLTRR